MANHYEYFFESDERNCDVIPPCDNNTMYVDDDFKNILKQIATFNNYTGVLNMEAGENDDDETDNEDEDAYVEDDVLNSNSEEYDWLTFEYY